MSGSGEGLHAKCMIVCMNVCIMRYLCGLIAVGAVKVC